MIRHAECKIANLCSTPAVAWPRNPSVYGPLLAMQRRTMPEQQRGALQGGVFRGHLGKIPGSDSERRLDFRSGSDHFKLASKTSQVTHRKIQHVEC